MFDNDIENKRIVNQLWQGFNILRGDMPTEDLPVYLYLLSAYYEGVININDFNSVNTPYGYLKGALTSKSEYDELYEYYQKTLDSIPINILNDLFQNLENIDIYSYNGELSELFDDLLFKLLDNQGRLSSVFALPPEISGFINHMAKSYMPGTEYDFVFNPFAGLGSLSPIANGCYYEGQEIHPATWALGKLRLKWKFMSENSPSYMLKDSIKDWSIPDPENMYDIVISNPPFGMKVNSFYLGQNRTSKKISAEEYVIERGLDSIRENGSVLCVASVGLLFRGGSEAEMRKRLVENNQLDTILYFPNGLLNHTGIPFCLVIVSRKRNSTETIRMIDASKFVITSGGNKILDSEALMENLNNVDSNDSIRLVGLDEIRENDYNLNVPRYFIYKVEGVKLQEFTSIISGSNADIKSAIKKAKVGLLGAGVGAGLTSLVGGIGVAIAGLGLPLSLPAIAVSSLVASYLIKNKGKIVKISNLKNDRFEYKLDLNEISITDIPKTHKIISESCILLSNIVGKIKLSYFEYIDEPIFIDQNITAFRINESVVRLDYLINEFHSDNVLEQVKAFSTGSVISTISTKDILNIKIALPSLKEQEAKVQGAKTTYLQSIGRELRLKKELFGLKEETDRNFKSVLHTMRQYLNALKTNVGGTSLFIEKFGNQGVNLNTIYSKNLNQTFGEHLTSLEGTITSMSKLLDSYENNDTSSKPEILKLESLVQEAQNRFKNPIKFKFEKVYIDHNAFSNELGYLDQFIEINKEDFLKVFSNIIFNAVDHGFINEKENYSIRTAIFNGSEKDEFILEISNNGSPLPENFTYKDLITRGEKSTSSKGSGTGGSDIKSILSKYNAYFELISDVNNEFPVKYILHFPKKSIIDKMEQIGYPIGSYSPIKIKENYKDE